MKTHEFIVETTEIETTDDKLFSELEKAGYKLIGSGADATVWTKSDSQDVIKIIMPEDGKDIGHNGHMFYKFYKFCDSHPQLNNLPVFVDLGAGKQVEVVTEDDTKYMAIGMEKLNSLNHGSFEEAMVWILSDLSTKKIPWDLALEEMKNIETWELYDGGMDIDKILSKIDDLNQSELLEYEILFKLMTLLYHTGNINKFGWDMHTENVMQRDDGTLVITDPWFSLSK